VLAHIFHAYNKIYKQFDFCRFKTSAYTNVDRPCVVSVHNLEMVVCPRQRERGTLEDAFWGEGWEAVHELGPKTWGHRSPSHVGWSTSRNSSRVFSSNFRATESL